MSKNKYLIAALCTLSVFLGCLKFFMVEQVDTFPDAFELPKGYWVGKCDCWCIDLCECGAKGFMETKSFLGIQIDYRFYKCPKQPTDAARWNAQQLEKEQRKEKMQELSKACDHGWIMINDHCERCDSSETFRVSESDCLRCNQYEALRVYDSQFGECRPK